MIKLRYKNLIKPILDHLFALSLFCLGLPLFLLVILLIKLDSVGPALYTQERVGKDGKHFKIYKFRTMRADADTTGPDLTEENDPRVTRVGRWLRRSSADELPQLLNILKGEMSFIGPRPEIPRIVATYTPLQRSVLSVLPGLSGWAQVHGRDALSIPEKLAYDLEYVHHQSLGLDLLILLKTFPVLLSSTGVN